MSKPQLRALAVILSGLIVVVLFAGLDDLPRGVRARIASERQALAAAAQQFQRTSSEVTADLRSEPELFRTQTAVIPARLQASEAKLKSARQDMDKLAALEKQNRRQDRDQAERLLNEEASLRVAAAADSSAVLAEANRWLEFKRNLPKALAQMERDHDAVSADAIAPVASLVEKAGTDWPEKKSDLDTRIGALRSLAGDADKAWEASAEQRKKAAAGQTAGLDYGALAAAADTLHTAATTLPAKSAELKNLTGQLYVAWDKILVDLEKGRREYRERVKTVSTRVPSAGVTSKEPVVSSDEKWVEVSEADYRRVEKNLGMAIEHKSAGKYDSEAERVAQPAGFAYIATPTQGSNQYGHWENRGGQSFWVWYGQYALLRDLLFHRDYRPLDRREYDDYSTARRSGRTWYGRDESAGGLPKYGSQGTVTERRYSDSQYAHSGGFRSSEYASRSGGFGSSRYASPSSRSEGRYTPRWEHKFPGPDRGRSFGSAPSRRSVPFRAPSRSFGRSFGRR